MLDAKLFELRDSMTFIPVLAVRLKIGAQTTNAEKYLLRRCGYSVESLYGTETPNIILCNADGRARKANGTCDPYDWNDRTYQTAHNYIMENWDHLEDGQVIDVEFILGETQKPKVSECHEGISLGTEA